MVVAIPKEVAMTSMKTVNRLYLPVAVEAVAGEAEVTEVTEVTEVINLPAVATVTVVIGVNVGAAAAPLSTIVNSQAGVTATEQETTGATKIIIGVNVEARLPIQLVSKAVLIHGIIPMTKIPVTTGVIAVVILVQLVVAAVEVDPAKAGHPEEAAGVVVEVVQAKTHSRMLVIGATIFHKLMIGTMKNILDL